MALPVSQEMQDDIRNNPDRVRISGPAQRRLDADEPPKLVYPAKGLSDHGLIAGLIYWRGELTSRGLEPEEER